MRSVTIDAEDEEDFIQQYDKSKSRLSEMIFQKKENQEKISEDEENDINCNKRKKSSFMLNDLDEEDYSDLGAVNADDDEELLIRNNENDDINNDIFFIFNNIIIFIIETI